MSGMRMAKKDRSVKSQITIDSSELKSIISSFLVPITNSLNNLNEKVVCLVNSLNKGRHSETLKPSFMGDLSTSGITADMIAEDTQTLSKNYSSLKEQVSSYQHNLQQINEKLGSMDKLLGTLVKRQTKKGPLESSDMAQYLDAFISSAKTAQLGVDKNTEFKTDGTTKTLDTKFMNVVTLNTANDFPLGSWLGDPDSPKGRVRCPIPPETLFELTCRCRTAEKAALALLDLLFSKETLSSSNISGKSKLGKKKLDPLMIYGIKCHLIHHFEITEKHWERIKYNIDSKCRTAWRKRRAEPVYCNAVETDIYAEDSQSKDSDYVPILQDNEGEKRKKRVLRTLHGDYEVFSSDQILRFQDFPNIHVLDGDNILPMAESDGEDSENEISLNRTANHSHLVTVEENRQDSVNFVMEPLLAEPLTHGHELLEDQDR